MAKSALELALAVVEAENNNDVDALVALNSEDFNWHLASGEVKNRAQLGAAAEGLFKAYPDRHTTVHDTMEDGDKAMLRWTAVAHAASDGTEMKQVGIEIFKAENGKITEVLSELSARHKIQPT